MTRYEFRNSGVPVQQCTTEIGSTSGIAIDDTSIETFLLDVDPRLLEPYYSTWMDALTGEKLHDKSDIACVLAQQSRKIRELKTMLRRYHEDPNLR